MVKHEKQVSSNRALSVSGMYYSDARRWKTLGVPVVKGGQNLPPWLEIELTDLQNIGGGGSVNPIPTRGQILPTLYYWHPQNFSPSGITELVTTKDIRTSSNN